MVKRKKASTKKRARKTPRRAKPAAPPPAYSEDGVDLTLIRWMLSLTPLQRLEVLQENVRAIMKLRGET